MKSIKSIIFDFDNTIAKNIQPIDFYVLDIVKKYNINTDEQRLLKTIQGATTNYEICEKLVPKNKIKNVYKRILRLNKENVKKALYLPEVIKLILNLKKYYTLHIISGRDICSLTYSLRKYNIENCFGKIIGADSGFKPKPSPEALEYILDVYNLSSSQVIFIGDSEADYLTAKKANCNFIKACWYEENPMKHDVVSCYNISSLVNIIENFNNADKMSAQNTIKQNSL